MEALLKNALIEFVTEVCGTVRIGCVKMNSMVEWRFEDGWWERVEKKAKKLNLLEKNDE